MTKEIVNIKDLNKNYNYNKNIINILDNVNFSLFEGDVISITGPSGSGKSTLLHILGLLDSQFSGDYKFLDYDVQNLSVDKKNYIRNKSIGFVHQFFHLIPELNVLENVALPNMIQKNKHSESMEKSRDIINHFGLEHRMYSKPNNLSGGEQQRVAIARSLINRPKLIIADEITGNLDEKTANSVFDFFLDQIISNKQSLIYVTHNNNFAIKAKKKYKIINQKLIQN